MDIRLEFSRYYLWRGELRRMDVEYVNGAVTVTEHDGDVHTLVYADGTLTGPGSLAASHRAAIAGLIQANLVPV